MMTIRKALVLSSLTAMILVGCLLVGVQQASALSVGESASYTILLPTEKVAVYQTYKTLGIVPTRDGPAYAIASKTDWYSYVDGVIGTQLTQRDLSFGFISVATSKLLSQSIDWRWYDASGNVIQHRVTSVKLKHIGKTAAIVDCVAYILSPEVPEQVTGRFKISADMISTQRNGMWYYMVYRKDYEIGQSYRHCWIYFDNGQKTWGFHYDDIVLIEKTSITVTAGKFLCYHFHRTTPWPVDGWCAIMLDEYAMVDSKATVYCKEQGPYYYGTIELTEYHPGWD